MNDSHKGWSIENGDYQRDYKSTETYRRKQERKRLIINSIKIFILIAGIAAGAYFIFGV